MKRICIILALGLLAAGCTDKGKQPEAEEFASLVTLPERYTVYRTADPIVVDGVQSTDKTLLLPLGPDEQVPAGTALQQVRYYRMD